MGKSTNSGFFPKNLSQGQRRRNGVSAGILPGGVIGATIGGSVVQEQEGDAFGFTDMTLRIE